MCVINFGVVVFEYCIFLILFFLEKFWKVPTHKVEFLKFIY